MNILPPVHQKFFYTRCQLGDVSLIVECLAYIPKDRREEVASKYEHIYLEEPKAARLKANSYIKNIAKEYRIANHGEV